MARSGGRRLTGLTTLNFLEIYDYKTLKTQRILCLATLGNACPVRVCCVDMGCSRHTCVAYVGGRCVPGRFHAIGSHWSDAAGL
eukprot:COSAG01_NODE_1068_length_11878_cov_45.012395_6_plen_84_part_00